MDRITCNEGLLADEAEREERTKLRIFEKVAKRMDELRMGAPVCAGLNPDVIVTSGDRTMLFEPQNRRALEWLHRRCGMSVEDNARNAVRVHPNLSQKIVAELKAAGFEVNC